MNSNAVDAATEDFITNGTSYNKATIFATVTKDKTYQHTFQTCNRFDGFTMDNLELVTVSNMVPGSQVAPKFWAMSMSKEGIIEKAYSFVVFVDEAGKTFTVNAALWPDSIPLPKEPDYNYMFNIQIWSGSFQDTNLLLHNVLSKLSGYKGWQVKYVNTDAAKPAFVIRDVNMSSMRVQSLLPETQTTSVVCSIRYPADKTKAVPKTFDVVLNPGLNLVNLPLGNALDATIVLKSNGYKDYVYVGSGYWLKFGKNITQTEVQPVDSPPLAKEAFLLGSAGMKGSVAANGGGGLDRTLNPNSLPVDISSYKFLSFWARGDGQSYSVQLETKAVRDQNSSNFHQYVITTTSEWTQYVIPLSSLKQVDKETVPFTGKDVISVAWKTIGAPLDSVNLEVCNAAFTN
ncbi:MAG TPA: CIA30 family protein [Syntrophomonadaceae bacterium]|nr:CIA30 family protein [Syntrophomonadaceae bacterium]